MCAEQGRGPVLCITFLGVFKGLLWFADVTLHSIWRESFPGVVRQGPSFALLSSLLGAASGRGLSWETPQGGYERGLKVISQIDKTCIRLMLHMHTWMQKTRWHPFLRLQPLHMQRNHWQAFKLMLTRMHLSDFYQILSLSFVQFCPHTIEDVVVSNSMNLKK